MLEQILNGAEEVVQGNLKMVRVPKGMVSIPVHAAVLFRGGDLPIAWVSLANPDFGSVVEKEDHPHAGTDATRYQIKQLKLAAQELREAQLTTEPPKGTGDAFTTKYCIGGVAVNEGEGVRFTFEAPSTGGPGTLVKTEILRG
jgi:hypothetical protein